MCKIREQLKKIANKYGIRIIYAFGSKAKEALDLVEGTVDSLLPGASDLDIGIKPKRKLTVDEKVEIALAIEDIFNVSRVDLVVISEAPIFLALEIVKGELLYAKDSTYEAEYQLYIMRRAAELIPYERMKQKMILGF